MAQLTRNAPAGDWGVSLGGAGAAPFTAPHSTRVLLVRQDSPAVAQLREAAEIARREGDRDGYLLARRLFLLAQAAAYQERRR